MATTSVVTKNFYLQWNCPFLWLYTYRKIHGHCGVGACAPEFRLNCTPQLEWPLNFKFAEKNWIVGWGSKSHMGNQCRILPNLSFPSYWFLEASSRIICDTFSEKTCLCHDLQPWRAAQPLRVALGGFSVSSTRSRSSVSPVLRKKRCRWPSPHTSTQWQVFFMLAMIITVCGPTWSHQQHLESGSPWLLMLSSWAIKGVLTWHEH